MIRIAVNSDSLATWFPEVIQRAGTELNLNFDIIPDDQEYTAERLRSGEALAAVTAEANPLHGCRRVPLGAIEYLAVATPRFVAINFRDGVSREAVSKTTHLVFGVDGEDPEALRIVKRHRLVGSRSYLRTKYLSARPSSLRTRRQCSAKVCTRRVGCDWALKAIP